jgi:hypothetical protein
VLKHTITYTDFNDVVRTEDFHFHLSVPDIVEMNVSHKEGLEEALKAIMEAEDGQAIMDQFKKIIGMTIGIKSADGRTHIKNDKIREEFFGSPAYDVLFKQLVLDADFAAKFVQAVVPPEVREEAAKAVELAKLQNKETDLAKPAPRIVTKSELTAMPRSELPDLMEKAAIGEVIIEEG